MVPRLNTQAAAARLQQYTSEDVIKSLPQNRVTDIYRETGPEEEHVFLREPTCDMLCYRAAQHEVQQGAQQLVLARSTSCRPHKYLGGSCCSNAAGG